MAAYKPPPVVLAWTNLLRPSGRAACWAAMCLSGWLAVHCLSVWFFSPAFFHVAPQKPPKPAGFTLTPEKQPEPPPQAALSPTYYLLAGGASLVVLAICYRLTQLGRGLRWDEAAQSLLCDRHTFFSGASERVPLRLVSSLSIRPEASTGQADWEVVANTSDDETRILARAPDESAARSLARSIAHTIGRPFDESRGNSTMT